jgi:hypothetical protein
VKPTRTPAALLHRLATRAEELSEERHREHLAVAPIVRYDCEEHRWHVRGPGTNDRPAMKSLCPFCRTERKPREAEQAMPETVTLHWYEPSPLAAKLWDRQLNERARAGELLPGSPAEREALRVVDDARADELYELKLTPEDRRRIHRDYWGRRLRVHGRQTYTPHPARAGP